MPSTLTRSTSRSWSGAATGPTAPWQSGLSNNLPFLAHYKILYRLIRLVLKKYKKKELKVKELILQNTFFLVREYHEQKGAKLPSERLHKFRPGQFCLIRLQVNKTKPAWKLRPQFQKQIYRILKVYKKSVLVWKFGDTSKRQRFFCEGRFLQKYCSHVRIQDIKIVPNPTNFLQLSVPQKLLLAFDVYTSNEIMM